MGSPRAVRGVVAAASVYLIAASAALAIDRVGDRAFQCDVVGVGDTQVLNLTNSTSAGQTLLVIGFVSGGAPVAATPISDNRANDWSSAYSYTAINGGRLFMFETRIAAGKSHTAGDTITLSYSGATGQTSCAVASLFDGLRSPSSADVKASASGSSTGPGVTGSKSTAQADEVVVAAFGFIAPTGGFTYLGSLQPMSGVCAAPYCMFPGFELLSSKTVPSATASTVNVTSWGAVLVTFEGDNTIFRDGFENGTTNLWSQVQE
jgi:hypothetical protein